MVTCQSANQLKTPAKVSWAFKMVSQFGSLGYTITGKTADLTVVQKTIIDTLHKEDKPQTFIAKEAVHRVLYPSTLTESWVEGKSVEEKDAQPTERTAALWGLSSKINSRIWMNFTRNGLRLGSRHQEHHTQTCRGIWLQFHFPAGFGTCSRCQKHQKLVKWPWCWCAWLVSKLTRPEPNRESMGYCQEEDEKQETKKCRWAEGHCQRNLGFHTTLAVPQTDPLHATPNWGSN